MDAVKGTAEGVNQTVKSSMDAVKGTVEDVNQNIKGTVNAVKGKAEDVQPSSTEDAKIPEKQRTYILVPVEEDVVSK